MCFLAMGVQKHYQERVTKQIVSKSFYKQFDQKSKTDFFSNLFLSPGPPVEKKFPGRTRELHRAERGSESEYISGLRNKKIENLEIIFEVEHKNL
jgi:hypothetical protein